jgi:hypothetical protein
MLLFGMGAAHQSGSMGPSPSAELKTYPLAKHVPSQAYTKLRGGLTRNEKWASFLYRKPGTQVICLKGLTVRTGAGEGFSVREAPASCKSARAGAQRIIAATQVDNPPQRILMLGFGSAARRVELDMGSGAVRMVSTKRLAARPASVTGAKNFAFVVVIERVPHCYTELRTIRANGSVIGGTKLAPC